MAHLIDLTHNVENTMPVHPYDDAIKLYQDRFLEKDKYNNFRLEAGMHIGTHLDSPMHMTNSNKYMNEVAIDRFMGKGCLLDVRGEEVISYQDTYENLVHTGDIVFLYTGHSAKYGTKEYYNQYPVVDTSLATFFIEKKIKILGVDTPSPDNAPFNVHKLLFNNDILIIENLTNLSELLNVGRFEIMAFPLKIRADASLVRVVAKVL